MRALLIAVCLIALTGCIPVSLHAITDGSDSHFDPQFVGVWGDNEGYWELTGGGNVRANYDNGADKPLEEFYAYDVYFTEAGKSSNLHGRLTTIDGVDFLDLTPLREFSTRRGNEDIGGEFIELMLSLPLHTWVKIEVKNGKLNMAPVELDYINDVLEKDPGALPHIYAEDSNWPIVTASTEQLRAFIAAHMNEENFFGEMADLTHLGPPTSRSRNGIQSGNNNYDQQYRAQPPVTKLPAKKRTTKKKKK